MHIPKPPVPKTRRVHLPYNRAIIGGKEYKPGHVKNIQTVFNSVPRNAKGFAKTFDLQKTLGITPGTNDVMEEMFMEFGKSKITLQEFIGCIHPKASRA